MGDAVSALVAPLDRDVFLRTLVRELAGALESIVGMREAEGCISLVGGAIGARLSVDYRAGLGAPGWARRGCRARRSAPCWST